MALTSPTMVETGRALIEVLVSDIESVNMGGDSLSEILAVLPTDPAVTIPLDVDGHVLISPKEAGEYDRLKYGGRDTLPDGLSFMFVPLPWNPSWDTLPRGARAIYSFQIEVYWKNEPSVVMTALPGRLHQMLTDLSEVLIKPLGPEGLANGGDAWDVTGTGGYLLDPFIAASVPSAQMRNEKRHEEVYYSLLTWTGLKEYGV